MFTEMLKILQNEPLATANTIFIFYLLFSKVK